MLASNQAGAERAATIAKANAQLRRRYVSRACMVTPADAACAVDGGATATDANGTGAD
jgi:hypothetical protein